MVQDFLSLFIALAGGLIAIFLLRGGEGEGAGILLIHYGHLTIFMVGRLSSFIIPGTGDLVRVEAGETVEVIE